MPRQSFLLHIALIKDHIAKRKWSQEEFALTCGIDPSRASRLLDATVPLAERARASLKTLAKIAAQLGYTRDGEHLLLTLNDDGTPYSSIDRETIALPEALIDPEPVGITATIISPTQLEVTIAAPEAIIALLALVQWNEVIRRLVSSSATAIVNRFRKGSVVLTIEADDKATTDLIASFLTWRLQHIGAYEMCLLATHDFTNEITASCLDQFRFANPDIQERCKDRILSRQITSVATDNGIHVVHLNPTSQSLDATLLTIVMPSQMEAWNEVAGAWGLVNGTYEAAQHAALRVREAGPSSNQREFYAAVELASGFQKAFRAFRASVDRLRAVVNGFLQLANSPWEVSSSHSLVETWELLSADWRAVDTALQSACETLETTDASYYRKRPLAWLFNSTWHTAEVKYHAALLAWKAFAETILQDCRKVYSVWVFRSTLSSPHIQSAEQYWGRVAINSNPPVAASFHGPLEPQRAILLDDETFLSQQYQYQS